MRRSIEFENLLTVPMARNLSSVSLSEALAVIFMNSDSEGEPCDPFDVSEDGSEVDVGEIRGDTAGAIEIVENKNFENTDTQGDGKSQHTPILN